MSIDKRSPAHVKAVREGRVDPGPGRLGGKKKLDKPWSVWRGQPTQRGAYIAKRSRTKAEAEAWVARYARSTCDEFAKGFHIEGPAA